jgi:hypothetical protein
VSREWFPQREQYVGARQKRAILLSAQRERLAELRRAVCQVAVVSGIWTVLSKIFKPPEGLDGTQQHGPRRAFAPGDNVCAEMHPIGEIDVQVATLPEHDLIAASFSTKRVARGVIRTPVRLNLDDPPRHQFCADPSDQIPAQEVPGDHKCWSRKEIVAEHIPTFSVARSEPMVGSCHANLSKGAMMSQRLVHPEGRTFQ